MRLINQIIKAIAFLAPVGRKLSTLIKSIPKIIEATEQLWKDGKIDVSERKIIANKAIAILARDLDIKLNWLVRLAISILIDVIAKQLPSRTLDINEVMLEAINSVKNVKDA